MNRHQFDTRESAWQPSRNHSRPPNSQPKTAIDEARASSDLSLEIPAGLTSLSAFLDWITSDAAPGRGRIDYIAGRLHIDMSEEEINSHAKLKEAVQFELGSIARKEFGEVLPDGVLFISQIADSGVNPRYHALHFRVHCGGAGCDMLNAMPVADGR